MKLMELPAIGSKMKMMELKVFLKLLKMFFGFLMALNTHGINEGSKEDKPDEAKVKEREKEKEKAEEEEDISSQEDPKKEEKEEEKAALTFSCGPATLLFFLPFGAPRLTLNGWKCSGLALK